MPSSIDSGGISATAQALGARAQATEEVVLEAFKVKDGDTAKIRQLALKLGFTEEEAKGHNAESLQLAAQEKHGEAKSLLGLLSEILKSAQQIRDRIIQNIGG